MSNSLSNWRKAIHGNDKNADGQAGHEPIYTDGVPLSAHHAARLRAAIEADGQAGQEVEPVAWMNPDNGVVIDAKQKKQVGVGYNYPNFSVPLYMHPAPSQEFEQVAVVYKPEFGEAKAIWNKKYPDNGTKLYIRRSAGKGKE